MKFKICLILFLLMTGFFNSKITLAQTQDIIINEIAWMGTEVSSNDEWIELKNTTNKDIDLEGWSLNSIDGTPGIILSGTIDADSYFLLERTDDESVPNVLADYIYVGALGNSGEEIALRDDEGNLVDLISFSEGWNYGDNITKQTMERISKNEWQTSNEIGGTPGLENIINGVLNNKSDEETDEIIEDDNNDESADSNKNDLDDEDENTSEDNDFSSSEDMADKTDKNDYDLGDVLINEFVADPADGDTEWIELYNVKNIEIDLEGWTVEEGSGAITNIQGIVCGKGDCKFLVIDYVKGNLNNSGDIIILRDENGNLIDQIAYGDWDDGIISNNAPSVNDPFSVARNIDGYNTYNNFNDFSQTSILTKGESNVIGDLELNTNNEEYITDEEIFDYSKEIIITEIFPNPLGEDRNKEWIEIKNEGQVNIDLYGWSIGDNSTKKYTFEESQIIQSGEYLLINRVKSLIALNNSGDSVKLYQPLSEKPLSEIKFEESIENFSYALNEDEINRKYYWTKEITPGEKNIILQKNQAPFVDFYFKEKNCIGIPILFDSSDTSDYENDELIYKWDFGDGFENVLDSPEHTYFSEGEFVVKLEVDDGENISKKEKIIKINNCNDEEVLDLMFDDKNAKLIISEIIPNPEGTDKDNEWIEIKNTGEFKTNLKNWTIDDKEGGSKAFEFFNDAWLNPGEYFVVDREESNIAMNNYDDMVRIINPEGEVVDQVEYEKSFEGQSLSRADDDKWSWSVSVTPGKDNQINNNSEIKETGELKSTTKSKYVINSNFEDARNFEVGQKVKVQGVVAVLPGVLGSQLFYITGSPGIQVYSYKKLFPELSIGDVVEVVGEISEANQEKRIKTQVATDIRVIDKKDNLNPIKIICEDITKNYVGSLVEIDGEVVNKKGNNLDIDNGECNVGVYVKSLTGISIDNIEIGDKIKIIGIISNSRGEIKVLPRSNDDIVIENIDTQGQVLGKKIENTEWEIPQRIPNNISNYLLLIAGGFIILISGLLIKKIIKTKNIKEEKTNEPEEDSISL